MYFYSEINNMFWNQKQTMFHVYYIIVGIHNMTTDKNNKNNIHTIFTNKIKINVCIKKKKKFKRTTFSKEYENFLIYFCLNVNKL